MPSADAVERFIDEFHRRQSQIAMQPSFLERIKGQLNLFFSHFHLPTVAYVGATAVAVFLSALILHSSRLNSRRAVDTAPLFSEESQVPLDYASSAVLQERIEPVTFDLKKQTHTNDEVVSPLSYILKQKTSNAVNDF